MPKSTSAACESENVIPPPPDPFPNYQTPYPQSSASRDQNPFILFKRFADAQITSLLSTFASSSSNSSNTTGSHVYTQRDTQDRRTSTQETLEALKSSFAELEAAMEKKWKDRSRDEEGYRKQIEQDWEERRIRNEQRMLEAEKQSSQWRVNQRVPQDAQAHPLTELALYERIFGPDPFLTPLSRSIDDKPFQSGRSSGVYHGVLHNPETGISEHFDPVTSEPQAFLWWTNSIYSPLRLKTPSGNDHSPEATRVASLLDWDAAFMDLIRSEEGGSMNDDKRIRHEIAWRENLINSYDAAKRFDGLPGPYFAEFADARMAARGWMRELDSALSKDWPQAWKWKRSHADRDDVQSRLISQSTAFNSSHSWSNINSKSPDDISYNTVSTNVRQLPDGSVETRQVTTIGFEDGTEESSETVDVHASTTEQSIAVTQTPIKFTNKPELRDPPLNNIADKARQEARRVGKGWFWN